MRGDGRVYCRGRRFWIGYYVAGKQFREAAGKTEADAKRKLKARLKEIAGDRFIGPSEERVTVGELLDDLVTHLRNKGIKALDKLTSHTKAVRGFFGDRRASSVTTPQVELFVAERLEAGRAATVNRELETLKQAFTLASRRTPPRVTRVPTSRCLRSRTRGKVFSRARSSKRWSPTSTTRTSATSSRGATGRACARARSPS